MLGFGTPPDDRDGGGDELWLEEDECEPELEPEEPPELCEEPGFDPPLPWWEDEGGGFEWPPPELFGGGLLGGGELFFVVGGGLVALVRGGGVEVVVGVVTFGHVSAMLATPGGSFRVDGGTPGGRW